MSSIKSKIPKFKSKDIKFNFSGIEDLISKAKNSKIVDSIQTKLSQIDEIKQEINKYEAERTTISRLKDFKEDIRVLNNDYIKSFIAENLSKDLLEQLKSIDAIVLKYNSATIVSVPNEFVKILLDYASKYKLELEYIPSEEGTPKSCILRLDSQIKNLKDKLNKVSAQLNKLLEKHYWLIEGLNEALSIEESKLDVLSNLGATDTVIVIQGWVPARDLDKLKNKLDELTKGKFVIEEIKTKELAPTKLENRMPFKLYEFLIKFYSLPKSNEIDPTIIFGIVFPFFFGLMVGDVGYSLFILFMSIWLIRRIEHPPKKSHIPRWLSDFMQTIISKSGMVKLSKVLIIGSIVGIIAGALFNEYFGFHLPYKALVNPELDLAKLLVFSGWVGVAMVSFGFILGIVNNLVLNDKKHAFGKLGWLLTGWAFVILGLRVLHRQSIMFNNSPSIISYVMLILGIGIILYSEGKDSLFEIPSLISHILSYIRLIGILLTSVILAGVINLISFGMFSKGVALVAIGILVLVLGQLFNIIIAIFESGIQGARLIYVEFFSKFFSGNGEQLSHLL